MKDCVFCKIIAGEMPSKDVYEDSFVKAFRSIDPVADTHVLVVPKVHVENFLNVNPEQLGKMSLAVKEVIESEGIQSGYKLIFNGGSYQEVPHLHWHVLGGNFKSNKQTQVMGISEKIQKEIQNSMKSGDKDRVRALKSLYSEIQNAKIDKRSDLDESDFVNIIKKQVKERKEAIDIYKNAGRDEKADEESKELEVLQDFLPQQMSEDEIKKIIEDITASGKDFSKGELIGEVIKRSKGRAEGSVVASLVNKTT